jgi:hypothetical protein
MSEITDQNYLADSARILIVLFNTLFFNLSLKFKKESFFWAYIKYASHLT